MAYLLRPGRSTDVAAWVCFVLVVLCAAAERPVAAADLKVSPAAQLVGERMDADEVSVRLLGLHDAQGYTASHRDARSVLDVVDRFDPVVDDPYAVHACRAPPVSVAF